VDGAILCVGDLGEYSDDAVHLRIVTLGDAVQGDKRVEHGHVDFIVANLLVDALDEGLVEHDLAIPACHPQRYVRCGRDNDVGNFRQRYLVEQTSSGDTPVELVAAVFAIVYPDAEFLVGLFAQKVAAGEHGDASVMPKVVLP
jgi:hypothetical protein